MKIFLKFVLITLSLSALAQDSGIDIDSICNEQKEISDQAQMKVITLNSQKYVVADKGFCAAYNISKDEKIDLEEKEEILKNISEFNKDFNLKLTSEQDCNCNLGNKLGENISKNGDKKDKWKVRFYASHSFTNYFEFDRHFESSRYTMTVKDYSWAERGNRNFFTWETMTAEGNNPLQIIDEPTNTFTISIEKNGFEFFLSAFHPKFLQEPDQVKYVDGVIDGTEVHGWVPLNKPFDGYDQVPGEMELVSNTQTHQQMTYELGFGYRFKLLDTKHFKISYVPAFGVGVMQGAGITTVVKPGEWWEFDQYEGKLGIQGYGGSLTNRIELNSKNEYFGIFYENKLSIYNTKMKFLDGHQTGLVGWMGNSIGMKFMIYNPNKHKKNKKEYDFE